MQFVDVLVQGSPVQCTVSPVVKHVLKDKEECDLSRHEANWGEGNFVGRHAKVAADRVEEVN